MTVGYSQPHGTATAKDTFLARLSKTVCHGGIYFVCVRELHILFPFVSLWNSRFHHPCWVGIVLPPSAELAVDTQNRNNLGSRYDPCSKNFVPLRGVEGCGSLKTATRGGASLMHLMPTFGLAY